MIDPNELLLSVDENNNVIEPQPRKYSHKNHIWHRSCHVYIIDSKNGLLLCQKRSLNKDSHPGDWEAFSGGHLQPGQTYEQGAVMEVGEEVGIKVDEKDLVFIKEFRDAGHPEYVGVFKYEWSGDASKLVLEEEEVDEVKWLPVNEAVNFTLDRSVKGWTHRNYSLDFLTN